MSEIVTIGLDLAKRVFQVHGADGTGHACQQHSNFPRNGAFYSAINTCYRAQEAEPGSGAFLLQRASTLHGRHGGLRRVTLLGPGDSPAGP